MSETQYRTDKVGHGYLPTYQRLARELGPAANVCEIGVAGGDSLDMWKDLFPMGLVVGVDNGALGPPRWPVGTVEVRCDMTSPSLPDRIQEALQGGAYGNPFPAAGVMFDLVVEDGPHNGDASRRALESMWPWVRPGGFYVIEDWYVGFPSWQGYGPSMVELARELLGTLEFPAHSGRGPVDDVEQITYRYGMIVLEKAWLV